MTFGTLLTKNVCRKYYIHEYTEFCNVTLIIKNNFKLNLPNNKRVHEIKQSENSVFVIYKTRAKNNKNTKKKIFFNMFRIG